ncbi:ABC transporter substrate-binding protein [Streptomyces sp. V1I6]|uniref:ABC transporter substrate-binding protein n=1 Tax=Streptomyces sp. V1I6 TaxID=3042273 RepID=UPI002780F354|nr:ABC transporter substrate-binding protein [Streptomyces sp. V1I6]MDQ0846445.1 peptide/nickel transport system substrate-binding protein [Streptomyces sp. V1I6]
MKSNRLGTAAGAVALLLIGGHQLLTSQDVQRRPIVIGTASSLTHLDPAGAYDSGSLALYNNVYQSLLTFEAGSPTPRPDVAKSCSFTDSALKTYQCELRNDVEFSNGHPVTAEAVKHSFERILRIRHPLGPGPLFANLRSVEARESLVTFHLGTADATWPYKIATASGSIVDPAEFPFDKLREEGGAVGSGPYTVSSYQKGKEITLEPNPAYKGAVTRTGTPIHIRYYPTVQDVEAAWTATTIDVAHSGLPSATLAQMEPGDRDVRLSIGEGAYTRYLAMNLRSPRNPLKDVAARRAVAALVDRGRLTSEVFHHTVTPLYSLVPQGVTGHDTAFFDEYPEMDPQYAAQRLRSAGLTTPVPITLGHHSGPAAMEARELKQQLEKNRLFQVELVEVADWNTYQKRCERGDFDAFTTAWTPDFPDPDNFVQPLVGTGNILHNGYASAEVDKAIQDTQRHADRGETIQRFRSIQQTVARDVPLVPLWQKKNYVVTRANVTGGHHLAEGNGIWRLWELKWL